MKREALSRLRDILPCQKLIEFPEKIVICSVYQHQADDIKDWRWSMKVSKAVNLFLDYHKMNSQKKYDQGLRIALVQIQGVFS
jgi:hypothetical protein